MTRVSYPVNNYFTLDRIDEDQAQDYVKRKGWDERDVEVIGGGDEVIDMKYFLTISKINIDLV